MMKTNVWSDEKRRGFNKPFFAGHFTPMLIGPSGYNSKA